MRARTKLAVCVGGALPAAAIVANGCRAPTEVTLSITTNVQCDDQRGVDVFVAADAHTSEERAALVGTGSRFPAASTNACAEGPAPRAVGTLVVTPSSGDGAVVVVSAFGAGASIDRCVGANPGPNCIIARRRFTFIDHAPVTLPILLDTSCAGVACNESTTCVGAKCVDSKVDCGDGTCTEPGKSLADGGPGADGAPPDAATDAPADAAIDAPTDGAVEASPALCPGTTTTCATPRCCYPHDAGTTATCAGSMDCTGQDLVWFACRGAKDCQTGEDCCLILDVGGTQATCMSATNCVASGGTRICSSVDESCANSKPCLGGSSVDPATIAADFYRCS